MKLTLALGALFASLAVASPLESRATTYKNVVADIATIKADLIKLNGTIASYNGGLDFVTPITIISEANQLNTDIQSATTDANSSAPFGKKGSTVVATTLLNLQSPIFSTLTEIVDKKPVFDAGILGIPLSPVVLQNLQTLKSSTDALGAAIVPKLTKNFRKLAPTVLSSIDSHFQSAITAYGGS